MRNEATVVGASIDTTDDQLLVLVGSYTAEAGGRGSGVISYRYHDDGALEQLAELAMPSPSWLEWHPSGPIVYCANEVERGEVSVVRVAADGSLTLLGSAATGGASPCHLAVTPDGRFLLATNYTGGSTAVFALAPDGAIIGRTELIEHRDLGLPLGPVSDRQDAPHAHMVVVLGDLVVVVDLGLDSLLAFRLDGDGRLHFESASPLAPGTGPRQIVRRAGTDTALVLGELAGSLTVVEETAPGTFTEVVTVPASGLPDPAQCAQLTLDPEGRWALVSNRRLDTISLFDLTADAPRLIDEYPVGPGWPRHFAVIGRHVFVGNQDGHQLIAFGLDPVTGRLTRQGVTPAGSPVCLTSRPFGELAAD